MRGLGLQYQVCNSISVVCSASTNLKMSILDPHLQTKYPKKLLFLKIQKTIFFYSHERPRYAILSL